MPKELVSITVTVNMHLTEVNLLSTLPEKWALCYRHFEHKDVDTNMLVER